MRVERRTQGGLKTCVVLVLFVAVCGGSYLGRTTRAAADKPAQKTKSESPAARGRTLYMQNCARCHGADGRSQTEMGELYGSTDLTDARWWQDEHISNRRLTNSITNGKKGGMPAYGKRLAKTDIAALVAYVRTLKH